MTTSNPSPAGPVCLPPEPCARCYADGYPACMCVVDYDEPAAGVEPPVVAVAGREVSACPDCGLPRSPTGDGNCRREHPNAELFGFDDDCKDLTISRLRSELSALRQQLEAERHGAWAAGHRAGWKDRFGSDCAFDQGYDPDEPTPNPYPPPPAEAPALPVGKETE